MRFDVQASGAGRLTEPLSTLSSALSSLPQADFSAVLLPYLVLSHFAK